MEISCAFPTALDSPDQIVLAEELGYDRAWLYDTPQQSTDVWVTLALAAERTGCSRPLAAPPDGQRRGDRQPRRAGPRARRRGVRDRVHRPPRDGLRRGP